eukprot:9485681-Pyramimonas_sp.AAC.1
MSAGINVAFPGYEVQRDPNHANAALEAMRDAYALDCRIRSAIKSLDLHHEWTRGSGDEASAAVRRNRSSIQEAIVFMHTSTESRLSVKICLATSRFGFFNAGDAVGIANCLNQKKEESGPADSPTQTIPAESQADAAITI